MSEPIDVQIPVDGADQLQAPLSCGWVAWLLLVNRRSDVEYGAPCTRRYNVILEWTRNVLSRTADPPEPSRAWPSFDNMDQVEHVIAGHAVQQVSFTNSYPPGSSSISSINPGILRRSQKSRDVFSNFKGLAKDGS